VAELNVFVASERYFSDESGSCPRTTLKYSASKEIADVLIIHSESSDLLRSEKQRDKVGKGNSRSKGKPNLSESAGARKEHLGRGLTVSGEHHVFNAKEYFRFTDIRTCTSGTAM
jgi:hypothetical protein